MFIRFEYPVKIFYYCNEKEKIQPEINFMFDNFKCDRGQFFDTILFRFLF
jgi:hypothetical protein